MLPSSSSSSKPPISRPTSRLSPPAGTDFIDHLSKSGPNGAPKASSSSLPPVGVSGIMLDSNGLKSSPAGRKADDDRVPKRGYRACVHCRLRKAKCDLGDVNSPSEPPCTRCRREQRNCVFLPSKRRRKMLADDDQPEIYPVAAANQQLNQKQQQTSPPGALYQLKQPQQQQQSHQSQSTRQQQQQLQLQLQLQVQQQQQQQQQQFNNQNFSQTFSTPSLAFGTPSLGSTDLRSIAQRGPSSVLGSITPTGSIPSGPSSAEQQDAWFARQQVPSQIDSLSRNAWPDNVNTNTLEPKPSPLFDPPTNTSHAESSLGSTSGASPNHSRKRKPGSEPDATRRIVVANFSNETDALEILANAATDDNVDDTGSGNKEGEKLERKRVGWALGDRPPELEEYILIKKAVLDVNTLELLVKQFFQHHHPVLPIFQTARIPTTRAQLAKIAVDDPFVLTSIVCVASHHHPDLGMRQIHDTTYSMIRETIGDYACAGLQPTIGFVEGILILAENLPRERNSSTVGPDLMGGGEEGNGLHGSDNRRSWALTGTAIRAAYGLGLDQIALEEGERTAELERARSVWTWCYLYDRTIGLRTGLAFWSRGPSICFNGYSHISQTGEAAANVNFPYMMSQVSSSSNTTPVLVDINDSASLMQAQMELTQIMTNAHDILFSTRARTSQLVRQGEYFKFLDHFRRSLDSFRAAWKDKVWRLDSVRELTWCTFHFVRLYVAAFAFQAHVQRAQSRAEKEREEGRCGLVSLFPRGSATSPDALFIYESIDAAHEILNICVRLGQIGVLRYLPSRYLINFAYSGTFALKAAYSGAVVRKDTIKTRELIDKVCAALIFACTDKDHPASRYGQMLRMLSRRLEELSDASAVPSRFPSPEPDASLPPVTLSTLQPTAPHNINISNLANNHNNNISNNNNHPHHYNGNDMESTLAIAHETMPADPAAALFDPLDSQLFDLDTDLNVGFNLEGFWEDFTLTDSGGFPFK